MIQPGMMFGGEGPVMQGTWYNPKTGDAFTVRDSFFEDNQYVVTTTDGRYLNYNQLQNYVQTDMKLEDLKKSKNKADSEELPNEIKSIIASDDDNYLDMLPEDIDIISKHSYRYDAPVQNTSSKVSPVTQSVSQPQKPTNINDAIIEKALKSLPIPKFTVNITWDEYPARQIEMLKDIMDIPLNDIVEWYLDQIQFNDCFVAFKESVEEFILKRDADKDVVSATTEVKRDLAMAPNIIEDEVKEVTNTDKKSKEAKKPKRTSKAAKK